MIRLIFKYFVEHLEALLIICYEPNLKVFLGFTPVVFIGIYLLSNDRLFLISFLGL